MGEFLLKSNAYNIKVVTNECENFDNIVICFHGFNGNMWGDAFSMLKDKMPHNLVCSFDSAGHGKVWSTLWI